MERVYISDLSQHVDKTVTIAGWVHVRRDQGKMVFFDFRDMSGFVQGIVLPGSEALETAKTLRPEWVVQVEGKINKRPEKMVNADQQNGDIELEILKITVLNEAETPPFEITESTAGKNEDVRLKYRYLDLRTERMQHNLRMRSKVSKFIRDFLYEEKFAEVETPMLTGPTPEGARDYVVPSRLWQGAFYALPQSPQQYKQLLMTAGVERYFQMARCLRDEDTRGDRQPEFTQMDMEMSFVTREDVMDINERMLIKLVETLYPEKKIQEVPFPRITYAEAMEKYGNDRPDLREDKDDPNLLAFCWVIDFPFFEKTEDSDDPQAQGEWTFTHNPFSRPKDEYVDDLMNKKNIGEILTSQYDVALNGYEIGGGSIRAHDPKMLRTVFEILGHAPDKIDKNFGHMLTALGSGTPPHGGIAWGFDRLMMILQNEPNIREVIPFAKTGEGKDLMFGAPVGIAQKQLDELGIVLRKQKEE